MFYCISYYFRLRVFTSVLKSARLHVGTEQLGQTFTARLFYGIWPFYRKPYGGRNSTQIPVIQRNHIIGVWKYARADFHIWWLDESVRSQKAMACRQGILQLLPCLYLTRSELLMNGRQQGFSSLPLKLLQLKSLHSLSCRSSCYNFGHSTCFTISLWATTNGAHCSRSASVYFYQKSNY